MFKKVVSSLEVVFKQEFSSDLISIYKYNKSLENYIMVFVVKSMKFKNMQNLKKHLVGKNFIVLTENDLESGKDIFSVTLLHIKNSSELLEGKDIFEDMNFDKKSMRHNLEMLIRYKLVELRESYFSFDGEDKFLQFILPTMEPIWLGISYLYDGEISGDKVSLLKFVNKVCECNGDFFVDLYDGKKDFKSDVFEVVEKLNIYLENLCKNIDKFVV